MSWAPVLGYEGYYEVSDLGEVRSVPRIVCQVNRWGSVNFQKRKGGPLCISTKKTGYKSVQLNRDGIAKTHLVHRLVASAFLRPFAEQEQVNHLDGNHGNNDLRNLEICTAKENSQHSVKTGLYPFGARNGSRTSLRPHGEANAASKLTKQDVEKIREMRSMGMSLKAIAAHFPVNFQSISNIVRGETWAG